MVTKESHRLERDVALRWHLQSARNRHRYLTLKGELDSTTEAQAAEIFDYAMLGLRERDLIVDLTELDFMDCTGVHLLVWAALSVRERNGRMRIRALKTGPVRRILSIVGPETGLDRLMETL